MRTLIANLIFCLTSHATAPVPPTAAPDAVAAKPRLVSLRSELLSPTWFGLRKQNVIEHARDLVERRLWRILRELPIADRGAEDRANLVRVTFRPEKLIWYRATSLNVKIKTGFVSSRAFDFDLDLTRPYALEPIPRWIAENIGGDFKLGPAPEPRCIEDLESVESLKPKL